VDVEVFTRWRADEVAAGVSDTSVLPLVEARGGEVYLCDRLHAKYFRFDDQALIGSANLTGAALGWSTGPNLELLVSVPAATPELASLEEALRRESVSATQAIADEVERVAALLPPFPTLPVPSPAPEEIGETRPWYPQLREPRDLYLAYSEGEEGLTQASALAAGADLEALEIPPGLARDAFEAVVATRLLQSLIVERVDRVLDEPQRFGAIRDLLGSFLGLERDEAAHAWQTLMRWMLHFMGDRYARLVPSHSELFVRRERTEPRR
jgi:hypothetical protein